MSYYSNKKDMKEKSLYNLYSDVDKSIINVVLNTFSKEYKTMGLVKAKYGTNYDGVGFKGTLSYIDEQRLQTFLMRFDQRIKCYETLIKKGKTIDEINNMFEGKNEIEVARIVGDILGTNKKAAKQEPLFKNITEILKKYKISMDELIEAVSLIEDTNQRLCYIYTYGIDRPKMTLSSIYKMLGIDTKIYHKYMMEIQKNIPNLLKGIPMKPKVKPVIPKEIIEEEPKKDNINEQIEKINNVDIPNDLHKIDIYKLIPNAHLIMDNPISNNDFVNIPSIEEIMTLYNEVKDSNKIAELLNIDKNRLIDIYIKNIELFTDISEIVNYIVLNGNINTIMLLVSKFNNEFTYIEKELIYLKLLQMQNKEITDNMISLITGLTIEDINNYRIMTVNDKINSLNKLL